MLPTIGILTSFTTARDRMDCVIREKSSVTSQENVTIKGRVTDEQGNAISNALIKIKNTSKASKSDVAGVFEFNDVPLKSVILISHTKFSREELKISKPKPYYRIVLKGN